LKTIFFKHGCLFPPILSHISEVQRPSGCTSESVMKIGGAAVFLKMTFNSYVGLTLNRIPADA